MEVSGQRNLSVALPPSPPEKTYTDTHCIGSWMGPGSSVAALENETNLFPSSGIEPRFLSRQALSLVAIPTEPAWLMRYIRSKHEPLAHRGFDLCC